MKPIQWYTAFVHEDGDGSVTVTSASLSPAYEKAFQVITERLQVGHMDVVTGREARRSIAGFLEAQPERRP